MTKNTNKKCCKGCKNGQPGQNESCKAKLLIEKLEATRIEVNQKKITSKI